MATNLTSLRSALIVEIGQKGADVLDPLLIAGVALYNAEAPQEFAVSGTVLDREASAVEQRALVLQAVIAYLNGKVIEASENAVSISNVAGKTDLTSIEWALSKRRTEIMGQLKPVMDRIKSSGVMSEVHAEELGETRHLTGTGTPSVPQWPW